MQRSSKTKLSATKKRRAAAVAVPVGDRRRTLGERIKSDKRLLAGLVVSVVCFLLLIMCVCSLLPMVVTQLTTAVDSYAVKIASHVSDSSPPPLPRSARVVQRSNAQAPPLVRPRPPKKSSQATAPVKSRPAIPLEVRADDGDLTDAAKEALKHAWRLSPDAPDPAADVQSSDQGDSDSPRPRRTYEELKKEFEGIDVDELNAALQAAMRDR